MFNANNNSNAPSAYASHHRAPIVVNHGGSAKYSADRVIKFKSKPRVPCFSGSALTHQHNRATTTSTATTVGGSPTSPNSALSMSPTSAVASAPPLSPATVVVFSPMHSSNSGTFPPFVATASSSSSSSNAAAAAAAVSPTANGGGGARSAGLRRFLNKRSVFVRKSSSNLLDELVCHQQQQTAAAAQRARAAELHSRVEHLVDHVLDELGNSPSDRAFVVASACIGNIIEDFSQKENGCCDEDSADADDDSVVSEVRAAIITRVLSIALLQHGDSDVLQTLHTIATHLSPISLLTRVLSGSDAHAVFVGITAAAKRFPAAAVFSNETALRDMLRSLTISRVLPHGAATMTIATARYAPALLRALEAGIPTEKLLVGPAAGNAMPKRYSFLAYDDDDDSDDDDHDDDLN